MGPSEGLTRRVPTVGFVPHVELIHRRRDVAIEQQLEGIDGSFETGIILGPLFRRDAFQHIVRGVLSRRRATHADFQPHELRRSHCLNDRLDAVVASASAVLPDAQASWL